jgi:hypothetical protein
MPCRYSFLASLGLAILLSACMSQQQRVENKEDLLAAAGFVARPANTPERQAMLHRLPPDRFVQRARGNQFVYLFADPLVCNCLYVGDQAAYGRYRQEVLRRQLANEQMMAAQMNEDAVWNWDAWGGPVVWY